MKGLLAYSGITTKVRAMESHLLTKEQLRDLAALDIVPEAVEFLKQQPAYREVFAGMEQDAMHRGAIEQRLSLSLYKDYTKLYRFASIEQRKFLDLYFMHFEIDILKKCLRNAMASHPVALGLSAFQDFFDKHSRLDLVKVSASESLDEFIRNIEGSIYYEPLVNLQVLDTASQFDYEMALDILYFNFIWKKKRKELSKEESKVLDQCFGSKLDLLNLQWIYRAKRYFSMAPEALKAFLIPITYKLKQEQLSDMTQAGSLDEFFFLLSNTYYGSKFTPDDNQILDLEAMYKVILNRIYQVSSRKNPYSIAVLNTYLYNKEAELHRIITIIESIRYSVDVSEIVAYIDSH